MKRKSASPSIFELTLERVRQIEHKSLRKLRVLAETDQLNRVGR